MVRLHAEEQRGAPPAYPTVTFINRLVDNGRRTRTVGAMFKLLSVITIAALSAFAIPATASAQDGGCAPGYAAVESVGGPLCVNPIYLDGTWTDPATCTHGYYQGSCAPETTPVVLPPEAYTFQMDAVPVADAPVDAAQPIVAPVVTLWLTSAELLLGDWRDAR